MPVYPARSGIHVFNSAACSGANLPKIRKTGRGELGQLSVIKLLILIL